MPDSSDKQRRHWLEQEPNKGAQFDFQEIYWHFVACEEREGWPDIA